MQGQWFEELITETFSYQEIIEGPFDAKRWNCRLPTKQCFDERW